MALRATPITGPNPDGLQADGSDVALIDVEAVDANGERCPTFQGRVDFTLAGPGVWRGGYNSGRDKSINNSYLDLECGVNRVAVRSTRTPGQILVTVTSEGLKPATVAIPSHAVEVDAGISRALPALPVVTLAKSRGNVAASGSGATASPDAARTGTPRGKYVKNLSYTGPTRAVHLEADAKAGKKIYTDREETFAALPPALEHSDWIQAAAADRLYNAVDLIEIPVPAQTVIYVAHDNRLDRPAWLAKQFQPTELSLTVDGKPMKVFRHRADKEESLTLGTNTENAGAKECNMYVVFVNALSQ